MTRQPDAEDALHAVARRPRKSFAVTPLIAVLFALLSIGGQPLPVVTAVDSPLNDMATTFVRALNTKDGPLLASLYAEGPSALCTDLDILVANQLFGHEQDGLVLNRLEKSQASGTPSGAAAERDGSTAVVFEVTWIYRAPDDTVDHTLRADVIWLVKRNGSAFKIVDQRTKPLDPDTPGC